MSKKRDDIFLDDDFGMDDFDDTGEGGFESPGKKGGRQPVTSLKGSFIEGVKDGIKDPSIQMKFVRAALPSGYNQTIDFADKVASGVNELYTDAAKEAAPVIKTLKEFTRKHVSPGMGDMLPKSWKEKLDSWAEEQESNSREVIDPEESEIAMTLGTMFQAQQEAIQKIDQAQQEREVEREGRQMADANVMQTQTDASLKTLAQIQQNTGRLANYQDQVTINFQRKSLELQYRTYFVNRKLLDVMEQHLDLSKSSFETLVHNSGLPDLLKAHNHEKMVEVMKMKYLGEMTDPMSKWFAGIGTKLIQKGKHDVKDFFQSFGSTLSDMAMGMDSFKEQQEMNREMGEREESMGEFGAKMMGSMAADKGSEWAGKLFGKSDFLRNSWFGQILEKTGFMLERLNRDKAYMYQDFVNNGEMNGGFLGNIARWFKEGSGTYSRDDRVLSNSADELDKQVYWSLQNSRTLNEVIPGLLTTINQSIIDGNNVRKAGSTKDVLAKATAMTKEGGGKIHYSFESNRFETESDILERVKKELNKPDRDKGLAEALTDVVNAIDEDYDLSEEIRNGIRAYVIELAANAVEMPRVDRWLVEAGDNFPEQLRGKTTNLTNDEDDHLGARGSWVKAISDVVKSTFGYKERVEWKDDKPIGKFSEAFQIFNRQPALNKLSIRYANLVSKLESNKEALIKFSKQGFGYQEVLRQNKYLVREQEKYKDAFGVEKSKDKIDAFDWRENIEGRNKNILNISRDDAETRAEKDYERALEAYNTAKEAYDEGLRTGMVAPGTAAPVEPTKPPHMRAAGGIIPDDGIDRFQLGGKKEKGSKKSQVKWKRQNGYVAGQGTGTSDEIPSYLSNGEYVVRAASVKRPGVMQLLRYINSLGDDDSVWGSSGVGESGDGFALNEAILAAGDKTEAQLVEVNNRLQKLIDKPFVALNFGDLTGPDLEKFKEMFGNMGTGMLSASDKLLLKGKEGVSKASSWLWDKAKWGADKTWGGITGTAKFGWDVVSGAAKGTKKIFNDWMEDARDIMVRGSNEVRIRADDIRNRLLYDVNTNEIIKSIKDITGEVRRIDTDEIVLSLEDFRKRLTDQRFKPMLTWVSKKYDQAKNIVFAPFRLVKSIAGHIGNILDMTDDIYVKGSEPWEPRMFVNVARAGKYIDAKSNKTINYVSDIKGAVLLLKDDGSEPTMVITEDEFNKGLLCDRAGNPLKGLREKVYNSIKKAGSFLIDVAKKGLEKARDFGGWIWDKLSGGWDGFKSWFDGTGTIQLGLFTTQTATVTRLEQIWMLLNDRLPGEKAQQPEDFGKMGSLRIPDLSGQLKRTEEWFNRQKLKAELKAFTAREKVKNKIALMEAKRQDQAAKLRAKYEEKGAKVPFWVRIFGANKQQLKAEVVSAGKAAVDGVKKAKNGIDKPMTFSQYLDWVENLIESKGQVFDRDDEAMIEAARRDYIEYRAAFDKKTTSQKIKSNALTFGGMAKRIGSKWLKGQADDIKETISDIAEDIRPLSFNEWLEKEWNMSPAEYRKLPMNSLDSSHSQNNLREAWGIYHHKFTMRLAKAKEARNLVSDKANALKSTTRSFFNGNKDFVGPMQPLSVKVSNFFDKQTTLRETLEKAKPLSFEEWLGQTPTGLSTYEKLGNGDREELKKQYVSYCIKFERDREAQLASMKAKTVKTITGVYNYFTKRKELTIDQYMDDIGVGSDEYKRMKASGEEKAIALKADYDAYMNGDLKAIARYNRLSAKQNAKSVFAKAKSLKDHAIAAKIDLKAKWNDRENIKMNAKNWFSGLKSKASAFVESDEDRYRKWQESHDPFNAARAPVEKISFPKYLDKLGLNEQEFDLLPITKKEQIIADFELRNRGSITDIPDAPKPKSFGKTRENFANLKAKFKGWFSKDDETPAEQQPTGQPADEPKQSLFSRMKGWGGKLKVSNPFKRSQSSDADGDGDRDGSAADQRQQREAAEEKGRFGKLISRLDEWTSLGKSARDKAKSSMSDKMNGFMDFLKSPAKMVEFGKTFATTIGAVMSGIVTGAASLAALAVKLPVKAVLGAAKYGAKAMGAAARLGSAVMGGGLGLLRTGAMVGANALMGAAGLMLNPVVLAVGATALAGYTAFKWFSNKMQNNDVLFRFRMLQYGFKKDDDENIAKILQMEKLLMPAVKIDQSGVAVLNSGIKAEQVMAVWGIDTTNSQEVERWIVWFVGRFKPIYLSHCTASMTLAKTVDLTKIDNLNAKDSLKYIEAVHFKNDGKRPYDIMASPVAGGDELAVSGDAWFSHSVDNEYDDAVDWIKENSKEIDLENQAVVDPKKAKELKELKDQKWQTKTQNAWNKTKEIAGGAWAASTAVGKALLNPIDAAKNAASYYGLDKAAAVAAGTAAMAYENIKESRAKSARFKSNIELQKMVYQAFINAGFTKEQAKALTAEVGRENDFRKDILFGSHVDPASAKNGNPIVNSGMISWNGSRRAALVKMLNDAGLVTDMRNGSFEQSQATLDVMAKFVKQEIYGQKRFSRTREFFENNPSATAEEMAPVVGKNYVVWAYGQDRLRNGNSFNWRAADNKRRGYLYSLESAVGGSSPAVTKTADTKTPPPRDPSGKIDPTKSKEGTVPSQGVAVGNMPPPPTSTASATPAKIDPTKPAASPTPTVAETSPATENAKPTATANMKAELTKPVQHVSLQAPIAKPDTAVTREGTEDVSVRPANELANTPVVSAAPITADPRAVASEGVIPVDVMAEKQKAEKEAALIAAEKRRQDALDATSTGMDASVAILKEQLRIAISMDNSLSKIEQHLAKMATMSKQQPASAAPAEKSSSQDMRMMTGGVPDNTPAPVSVSRRT